MSSTSIEAMKKIEMKQQLAEASTEEERQNIANSDLYSIAVIEGKDIFYHEALWTKVNRTPIPTGMLVSHKDGDPTNNEIENLELVEENTSSGDLHKTANRIFHEENVEANKIFLQEHFLDVYEILFPEAI
jgi:hypothetical protein